jgi:DNA-binding protein Fis
MFKRNRINMSNLVTTSKLSLKMSCLQACNNDVAKATQLYNYIADGLDLPDVEPMPISGMQKVMGSLDSVVDWLEGHQPQIEKAVTLIQLMTKKQ